LRIFLCFAFILQTTTALPPYVAARYVGGGLPPVSIRAVGGGEVWLEVPVTRDGVIPGIKVLRATPPFTDALTTAVNGWRFAPAEQDVPPVPGAPPTALAARDHVDATVLVAAVILPPSLNAPTLGEPPKDFAAPSSPGTPVPSATSWPLFPPRALMGGIVLVEARIAPSGDVADAKVIASAPPFDQPALDAARQWKFRP
jgi:TonB family protein